MTRLTAAQIDELREIAMTARVSATGRWQQLCEPETIIALLDMAQGGGWRPIESAPKDGMFVLITGLLRNEGPQRWVEKAGFFEGAWRMEVDDGRYSEDALYPPTHWQQLPAPPAPGATDGGGNA